MGVKIKEIEIGDIFSESSHYVYVGMNGANLSFKHTESGELVNLNPKYVENLLATADQYSKEVRVGKEDKLWTAKQITDAIAKKEIQPNTVRPGDVRVAGIRTIFENIHSAKVFTCSYNKQGKELSGKALSDAKQAQLEAALESITKAAQSKRGVAKAAEQAIKEIQENPISPVTKGDERILRGYKVQFGSRDGRYDCVDMDISDSNNIRPVNINTLNWIAIDGVKYVKED